MSETLKEYWNALDRLIKNKPINVLVGTKINNDSVALEAGRKRGSIKKSREIFWDLIEAIKEADDSQNALLKKCSKQKEKYKNKAKEYKKLYEEALNRELMMLEHINHLEKVKTKYANNSD